MDAVLLKAAACGREVERRREAERKRALLVLILRHLLDHGYVDSMEHLTRESSMTLSRFDAADNIALLQVLQDWEEAHEQRYGRRPRLIKAVEVCGAAQRLSDVLPRTHLAVAPRLLLAPAAAASCRASRVDTRGRCLARPAAVTVGPPHSRVCRPAARSSSIIWQQSQLLAAPAAAAPARAARVTARWQLAWRSAGAALRCECAGGQ
jgi:hypothetical protein